MWNQVACNRVVQKRVAQKNKNRHSQNIENIKSMLLITEPHKPLFLGIKPKQKMYRNLKNQEIDRENSKLITRIRSLKNFREKQPHYRIKTETETSQNMKKYRKKSREMKKKNISDQNRKMLGRLIVTNSTLSKLWDKKTSLSEINKTNLVKAKISSTNLSKKKMYTQQISPNESFLQGGIAAMQQKIQEEIVEGSPPQKSKSGPKLRSTTAFYNRDMIIVQ